MESGFVPKTDEERLLLAPPSANRDVTNWQEESESSATLDAPDSNDQLDAIRRQLEGCSDQHERIVVPAMVDASDDRGHLLTEQSNPRSRQLDTLPVAELVDLFISEDVKPQQAVAAAADSIAQAVEGIAIRLAAGGRLFYVGAGTSGRLGVLDAAECPPTFCSPPELVQGVLAGGAPSLLRSSEGLEDPRRRGR